MSSAHGVRPLVTRKNLMIAVSALALISTSHSPVLGSENGDSPTGPGPSDHRYDTVAQAGVDGSPDKLPGDGAAGNQAVNAGVTGNLGLVAGIAGIAVIGGVAAAMGAGGSSGGGDAATPATAAPAPAPAPSPTPVAPELDPTPAPYVDPATAEAISAIRTPEYLSHGGYDRVNLAHAYARGYSGTGQLIAVIDDGFQLDHPEFSGAIINAFPAGGAMPVEDHGTHVAGIAAANRDGLGMHGAAHNANLAFYQYGSLGTNADSFNRASAQGATVISNSWGYETTVADVRAAIDGGQTLTAALASETVFGTAGEWQTFLDSMVNAQTNGAVVVFAASNDETLGGIDVSAGMPLLDSRLNGPWLAVVNVDSSDHVISIGCGEAKAFCLAAPGTDINSALPVDTYGRLTGTSMATPLVSGAVALVVEAFGLSPTEAAARLLTTADRSFAGYDADAHGQGILDLDTATRPIGRLRVIIDGDVHGGDGPDIGTTTLLTARAFGDSVSRALSGMPIAAFDEGGAAFLFDMGSMVSERPPAMTALDTLQRLGMQTERQRFELPGFGRMSMLTGPSTDGIASARLTADPARGGDRLATDNRLGLLSADIEADIGSGRVRMGFHESADAFLAQLAPDATGDAFNYSPGLFAAPYAGFAASGYSFGMDMPLTDSLDFSVLTFTGEGTDNQPFSGYGAIASLAAQPSERFRLSLDGGALIENDTIMGASAEGAFRFGGSAQTMFVGLNAEAILDDRWSLVGSVYHGWTSMDGMASSLIQSIDGLETRQMALGIVGRDVALTNDAFGLAVSQPMRVESGRASLTVPEWRNWSGTILNRDQSVDLQPSGREIRLEATYGFDLAVDTRLTALAFHRIDAGHVAGREETSALVRLQHRF